MAVELQEQVCGLAHHPVNCHIQLLGNIFGCSTYTSNGSLQVALTAARPCGNPTHCFNQWACACSGAQGDPSAVPYAVENVREVLGKKPVFGICMGHQLLGQVITLPAHIARLWCLGPSKSVPMLW